MQFSFQEIGIIHTPLQDRQQVPIQSSRSNIPGTVEIFTRYLDGLDGVEEFSNIYLIYGFHQSDPSTVALTVKPFLDDRLHGVFATRYPNRPNPIGLSVVRLVGREENVLSFLGADMLDGTPLFDIKPYIPEFDVFPVQKTGWYQTRTHR